MNPKMCLRNILMPLSLTSISPGEETDNTVTVETTPSSANITPSQSSEWPHSPTSLSASAKLMMTTSGVSFTTIQVNRAFFLQIRNFFFVALSFSVKMKDDKSAKNKTAKYFKVMTQRNKYNTSSTCQDSWLID